jgi:hypothetical protein
MLGLGALLVSCSHAPTAPPAADDPLPVAEALPEANAPPAAKADPPPAPVGYRSAWEALPEGAVPKEWVDVQQEGYREPWLYDGGWRIAAPHVFQVSRALTNPPEPLSFMRYRGDAFGPDGRMPTRYEVQAEARSLGGSTRFGGYGEVAIQVCFRTPRRYVEVLHTDEAILLWEATDAPPGTGKGWKQLAKLAHPRAEGEWFRFGARVDRATGQLTVLVDGRPVGTARSPLLEGDAPGLTIRATGNREEWRWVTIQPW